MHENCSSYQYARSVVSPFLGRITQYQVLDIMD